ncbi:type II toxin-antitoxin system HicA family toxin [bacterium]|nr:type II toxin-antitoxin system HicA family toxin [bacterium]
MPELPHIYGTEAIKVFNRLGFEKVRQKGSHAVLRRKDRGGVVPLHKELAFGTLRSAIKQSGISVEDFIEAYEKK